MANMLIPLQHANAYQEDGANGKTDWLIRENQTNRPLFELDKTIRDEQIFQILDFARKYELEAFNKGIEFQKKQSNKPLLDEIKYLREQLEAVTKHDEMLANKLEALLINEDI